MIPITRTRKKNGLILQAQFVRQFLTGELVSHIDCRFSRIVSSNTSLISSRVSIVKSHRSGI